MKISIELRLKIDRYFESEGRRIYDVAGNLERERLREETEEEYLRRLDLLEDWEIKELKK